MAGRRGGVAEVLPTRDAREALPRVSEEFSVKGAKAEPVFFGRRRKPEGVMLSYERYLDLLEELDDLSIALEVRRRERADAGTRLSLEELIRDQGFDPADFGIE